jgi:hypothetical protein
LFTEDYIKNNNTDAKTYQWKKKKKKKRENSTKPLPTPTTTAKTTCLTYDVDAAGSSVDPEYDSDTQSPDAKINGEGGVFDSDPDSINTRRIVLVEETRETPR